MGPVNDAVDLAASPPVLCGSHRRRHSADPKETIGGDDVETSPLNLFAHHSSNEDPIVERYRPRPFTSTYNRHHRIHKQDANVLLVEKFSKYERTCQEDDYRQRMIMNGIGFVETCTGSI